MTGFHEVRFPEKISYGAVGGPSFATDVVASNSGYEQRNAKWQNPKRSWDISTGIRNRADMEEVLNFFLARKGRLYGFLFKDWFDYKAENQLIGIGDGETLSFSLIKKYGSSSNAYIREIKKPIASSLKVKLGNDEITEGFSITNGKLVFTNPPEVGKAVFASFEFDVPARFDTDIMDASIETHEHFKWGPIPVVEIRL